jgi:hypothetical protein
VIALDRHSRSVTVDLSGRVQAVEDVGCRSRQHAVRAIKVFNRDRNTVERQSLAAGRPLACGFGHLQRQLGCRRDVGVETLDLIDGIVVGGAVRLPAEATFARARAGLPRC